MSSEHPEQRAEQAADRLPAHSEEERREQPIVRRGMFGAKTTGDTSGYGGLVVRQSPKVSTPRPYGGPGGAAEPGEFDDDIDDLAPPKDLPPCGCVRAGSTKPCPLWVPATSLAL